MCTSFAQVAATAAALVDGLEPATIPVEGLRELMAHAARVEKLMALASSLCASRLAALAPPGEADQVARDLARSTGTSLGEARRALDVARSLRGSPELEVPARRGLLSRPQLALLAPLAKSDPAAAADLAERARRTSLQELSDAVATARASTDDMEARRERVRRARSLRHWTGPDGTWHLRADGPPEAGAVVMAAIATAADQVFAIARREGRREPPAAYAFDGLTSLASGTAGMGSPRYEVLVRVDLDALLSQTTPRGSTCELVGFGPISASSARELLETGDPFLKAIVTKGKAVAGVAHLGRRPNAYQRSALDWLFPTCAAEGCSTRAHYLESDHRTDWAKTHLTVLDLLDRLCKHHHDLKTYRGWALVQGTGKRPFVPPDDERHPARRAPGTGRSATMDGPGAPRPTGPGPGRSRARPAAAGGNSPTTAAPGLSARQGSGQSLSRPMGRPPEVCRHDPDDHQAGRPTVGPRA